MGAELSVSMEKANTNTRDVMSPCPCKTGDRESFGYARLINERANRNSDRSTEDPRVKVIHD